MLSAPFFAAFYHQQFLNSFQNNAYLMPPRTQEDQDDPRLVNCPYQTQYQKNYGKLKNEHKSRVSETISFIALKKFLSTPSEERTFNGTIYAFLCALSFYELNNKVDMGTFSSKDWEKFGELFKPMTSEELISLGKSIFKPQNKELKHRWSPQEDLTLQKIILENHQKRLPWKKISRKFNETLGYKGGKQKKASQCSERWKNFLSKRCKKGTWTKEEDLTIISFVIKNGSKWSKLAKLCPDRTEHNVKNRFFSLISKHYDMAILKIKESFDYMDPKVLEEVKKGVNA